ncbi:hypothetical protein CDL15_Pgr004432 [Punica granatum]|uniref:Uncharacterized protein n=1 Tax=Punica granatum TaxID=22663 RepID=A0A218XHR6_PUNGR|nr:hypothetical protein CDL15_Pgr004432 [Punica granatum]PKI64885.1 hypothetical protein CRG98_014728 [Punica granatum]
MVVELISQILLRKEAQQTGSSCCGGDKRWNKARQRPLGWGWGFQFAPLLFSAVGENSEEPSPKRVNPGPDDRFRDFMLKRSYSFKFKMSIAPERCR